MSFGADRYQKQLVLNVYIIVVVVYRREVIHTLGTTYICTGLYTKKPSYKCFFASPPTRITTGGGGQAVARVQGPLAKNRNKFTIDIKQENFGHKITRKPQHAPTCGTHILYWCIIRPYMYTNVAQFILLLTQHYILVVWSMCDYIMWGFAVVRILKYNRMT